MQLFNTYVCFGKETVLVSMVAIFYPVVLICSVKIRAVRSWQNADALNTIPCIIIGLAAESAYFSFSRIKL